MAMRPQNSNQTIVKNYHGTSQGGKGLTVTEKRMDTRKSNRVFPDNPLWTESQRKCHRQCWDKMQTLSKFAEVPAMEKVFFSIMGDIQFNLTEPLPGQNKPMSLHPDEMYYLEAGYALQIEMFLATRGVEVLDRTPKAVDLGVQIRYITDNWGVPFEHMTTGPSFS